MKHIKALIKFTGIWSYFIGLLIEGYFIWQYWEALGYGRRPPRHDTIRMWFIYPLILPVFITLYHMDHPQKRGVTEISEQKKEAMYPDIPKQYLIDMDKPDGIILGEYYLKKNHKKYLVRYPILSNGLLHTLVLGNSGVGKTSCIYFPLLIANAMNKPYPSASEKFVCYSTDPKPELFNAVNAKSRNIRIMNLSKRDSWGFDVYYCINNKTTETQMSMYLKGIAKTLITGPDEAKFFTNSAIKIFVGLMLYYHKLTLGFIDSIHELINNPLSDQIARALSDKSNCRKGSIAYSLLVTFGSFNNGQFVMKDSKAIQDIEMSLQEELPDVFNNAEVIWAFRDCPNKASPADLQNGISLFDSSPENYFDDLPQVFRLKIFLILRELKSPKRQTSDVMPCVLLIEEAFKIGKIPDLEKSLATIRSKAVSVILCIQDPSQLEILYSEKGARSIINLCRLKLILSCDDANSGETICKYAGDFRDEAISKTGTGSNIRTTSSDDYRKIIQPSDLMKLDELEETIIFVKGRYMRIKKHYYFKDPILYRIYKKNLENNDFLN